MGAMTAREKGREAARLRATGMMWKDVARQINVPIKNVAWLARMYGTPECEARTKAQRVIDFKRRRPPIGYAVPHGMRTGPWIERVKAMRSSGMTMIAIAGAMGVNENVVIGALYRERARSQKNGA